VIAAACAEVGVRAVCSYGVTDRHGHEGARRGLGADLAVGVRDLVVVATEDAVLVAPRARVCPRSWCRTR